jgi:hypothetical protein
MKKSGQHPGSHAVALAAFGSYKLVSWFGMRLLPAIRAERQQAARLVLLRTFGFRRRSERFFDQLNFISEADALHVRLVS